MSQKKRRLNKEEAQIDEMRNESYSEINKEIRITERWIAG